MRITKVLHSLPDLPPRETWRKLFPAGVWQTVNRTSSHQSQGTARRTQVADDDLADELVESFKIKPGSIVLEAWPGLGFMTRALLRRPEVEHVIAVEPAVAFLQHALGFPPGGTRSVDQGTVSLMLNQEQLAVRRAWEKQHGIRARYDRVEHGEWPPLGVYPSKHDSKLSVVEGTLYDWSTTKGLKDLGCFDGVQKREWMDDPPNLHVVVQIPDSILGEQLTNQWIGCMANRNWIFAYGRTRMSMLLPQKEYFRMVAPPGSPQYGKLGVNMQALASWTPASASYPHAPTFFKKGRKVEVVASSTPPSDLIGSIDPSMYQCVTRSLAYPNAPPLMALTLEPRKDSAINADNKDAWDYVTRRMFVVSMGTLETTIRNLGPGAENLLPKLGGIDKKKKIREFETEDWLQVVTAFEQWKFKPDVSRGWLLGFDLGANQHFFG